MYTIRYSPQAEKSIKNLPKKDSAAVLKRLDALAMEPRPHGMVRLRGGFAGYQRIRVGDYRVIYRIQDSELLIFVVKVARRDQVYSH